MFIGSSSIVSPKFAGSFILFISTVMKYFHNIIAFFFCLSYVSVVQSKAAKMLSLSPLKCAGKVTIKSNNIMCDTVFLCKSGRLEVIDDNNKENPTGEDVVTICDVVPLVLDYNPLLKEGT